MLDLVLLSADVDIEASVLALIDRPGSLGIRRIDVDPIRHPGHDPGIFNTARELLRPYAASASHALAVLDCAWDGNPHPVATDLETRVGTSLSLDWNERAAVIAIDPEVEVWLWSASPHVAREIGWAGSTAELRQWLGMNQLWNPGDDKPADPKAAFERACRHARSPATSAKFRAVLSRVSLARCTDGAFHRLQATLQSWFPPI